MDKPSCNRCICRGVSCEYPSPPDRRHLARLRYQKARAKTLHSPSKPPAIESPAAEYPQIETIDSHAPIPTSRIDNGPASPFQMFSPAQLIISKIVELVEIVQSSRDTLRGTINGDLVKSNGFVLFKLLQSLDNSNIVSLLLLAISGICVNNPHKLCTFVDSVPQDQSYPTSK